MNSNPVLELQNVEFGWQAGTTLIHIDRLLIQAGQSIFLGGPSGCGKSTLLGLIGGVIEPRSGCIKIQGQDITTLSPSKRDQMRADHLGIIFQQFNLLPFLSVINNVILPCRFSHKRAAQSRKSYKNPADEAYYLLDQLGLPRAAMSKPVNTLSVGQQQRVALARALIGGPELIIADEPTSALDMDNRDRFIELLNQLRHEFNTSLLFVSHDKSLAKHFDRTYDLTSLNLAEQASVPA